VNADAAAHDMSSNRTGIVGRALAYRATPSLIMAALVLLGGILPLYRNSAFYYWDDTAAAAVPIWRRFGEAISSGRFPFLELDLWRGGNFAAEVSTGMWNPVEVLLAIGTQWIDNLAIAITIVKLTFMVMFAVGTYLLAREYGVRPWIAAAIGAALPLSGYVLYMDSTTWINALISYGFMPFVWLTARRAARSGKSVVWVVLAGYLACTTGNPYEVVSCGLCVLAVMVETWFAFNRKRLYPLVGALVAVGLLSVIVYLPLALSLSVTYRSQAGTFNDGFLSPRLQDLFAMSNPGLQPMIQIWGGHTPTFPALYAAWFIVPLLPWLSWRVLAERWRALVGLVLYTGVYLLLILGPSNLGVFRWPIRMVPFMLMPLIIIWGILASQGLQRTRTQQRTIASLGIIAFGAYLGWADLPPSQQRQVIVGALLVVLVLTLIRTGLGGVRGFAVMSAGTMLFLGAQLYWFPGNYSVNVYHFPTSRQTLQDRFHDRYTGVTVQIADYDHVPVPDRRPDGAYRDLMFGSNFSLAGVESLTAYSGIGFNAMDAALCTKYQGSTDCPNAWDTLWIPPAGSDRPLADLVRAQTVVVQNVLLDLRGAQAPAGWARVESTDQVTVWKRQASLPYPDGRLSAVSDSVQVQSDRMTGRLSEAVRFTSAGSGSLVFARLAWPGYQATINGRPVPVRGGADGLVTIDVPAGVQNGELRLDWSMPGLTVGLLSAIVGLALTLLLGAIEWRRRRASAGGADVEPTADDADHAQVPQPRPPATAAVSAPAGTAHE
jgi:hypothetical protein